MPSTRCVVASPVQRTPRVMQLEGLFDVPPSERSELAWQADLPFDAPGREWNVGLIVGRSGCGKSTIARALFGPEGTCSAGALVEGYKWPGDKSILDAFPKGMSIKDITGLLSSVGFSSPPSWVRPFRVLSNGEQFRVTIARALAEQPELAVIDEFTSVVDRTVARIGSAAIAKTVRRRKQQFVGVTCHYDVIDWLAPDWIYEPETNAFQWRPAGPAGEPFRRPPIDLEIVRVHPACWRLFRPHHYLSRELHRASRCFVASVEGDPAAFTAALHSPSQQGGFWREHRTVCLPDFQGVGIGNALSDFVASLFACRKTYRSTTSHPAMIHYRHRSPHWQMTRGPSHVPKPGPNGRQHRNSSVRRITASFRYVGPKRPDDARRFGITT